MQIYHLQIQVFTPNNRYQNSLLEKKWKISSVKMFTFPSTCGYVYFEIKIAEVERHSHVQLEQQELSFRSFTTRWIGVKTVMWVGLYPLAVVAVTCVGKLLFHLVADVFFPNNIILAFR